MRARAAELLGKLENFAVKEMQLNRFSVQCPHSFYMIVFG